MVVKKSATKTATKKTPSKAKKALVTVSGNMCFWVNNGPILSSLRDLESALKKMSDAQYNHHVGKNKNDFSSWVRAVLHDTDCASQLQKAKSKNNALICVSKALGKYN